MCHSPEELKKKKKKKKKKKGGGLLICARTRTGGESRHGNVKRKRRNGNTWHT